MAKKVVKEYSVIYLRVDGWWEAGRGFSSVKEGEDIALENKIPSFKIVPTFEVEEYLCEEALISLHERFPELKYQI